MAPTGRRTDPSLTETLFALGCEFDFFQAVRLLGRVFPRRKAVGGTAKPAEEIARFRAWPSLAFPASAVHEIDGEPDSPGPVPMTVTFMALTGVQGVLPFHYTERIIARRAARDNALAAFFDLFNHRVISLFYRAWEKYRAPVLYESAAVRNMALPAPARKPDSFTHALFDLIGIGTDGLRERMRIPDEALLLYAGLIAQRPHSASALRAILRDYFSIPVEIDQCVGKWSPLEENDRCYLSPAGEHNQLGGGAVVGDEVWDQQARFRIRLGPLPLKRFQEFLPDGKGMAKLMELTRFLVGRAAEFEVQVLLEAAEVPYPKLEDHAFDAPRLGFMGWLKTEEFVRPAGDARFAYIS